MPRDHYAALLEAAVSFAESEACDLSKSEILGVSGFEVADESSNVPIREMILVLGFSESTPLGEWLADQTVALALADPSYGGTRRMPR